MGTRSVIQEFAERPAVSPADAGHVAVPGPTAPSRVAEPESADLPLVVIEPGRGGLSLNLRDLWQYRELLYFLTWRDLKVRYKQTVLGAGWAVIQPLFTMLVFTVLFGKLAKVPSDSIPYPLFAYAGLLPWTFFSNAIANSGNSLVGSSHLISKVYFPRMIIPGSAVLAGLVDLAIALGVFGLLMAWYRVPPGAGLLLLPVLILLTALLALGVGMWLSALNVRYRDIRYAIPFGIQLWMFLTPVIYPSSILPGRFRLLYSLNPLAGIIEAYRVALCGTLTNARVDWYALALSCVVTIGLLAYAARRFRRMESTFADFI